MADLPYLARREGGRYYIQIRLPPGPAWPSLLRLSLQTSDPKIARHNLCNALSWLMPFRDAEALTRQAEQVLAQCRRLTRAGPAETWQELYGRKKDAGETRLFPEWEHYRKLSGKVLWDRPLTRDWQYRRKKLELERKNIPLYSSRHAFGDRLDKAEVPQRIRDRLMGHAPTNAKARYGSNRPVDRELAATLQKLETPVIKRMRAILVPPYQRAIGRDGMVLIAPSWIR